jgi:hypothetical protein
MENTFTNLFFTKEELLLVYIWEIRTSCEAVFFVFLRFGFGQISLSLHLHLHFLTLTLTLTYHISVSSHCQNTRFWLANN